LSCLLTRSISFVSAMTCLRWILPCLFAMAVCFSQPTPVFAQGTSDGVLDSNGNKIFGSVLKELMRMIPEEAQAALEKLEAANSRIPPTKLMLAAMAYAVGDSISGKRLLESAAISDGDYPDIYFSFARLALGQNRITDADALADKALLAVQSSNGAFDSLQINHFKRRYYDAKYQVAKGRGKAEDAKAAVAELVAIAPQEPQTLVARAEVAFEDNDMESALGFLRKIDQQVATQGQGQ